MFHELLRSYGSKYGIRNRSLSDLLGFKHGRLQRLRYTAYPELTDLKELKNIESFFKVDLKEYYPTQCSKIQEYILKRLDNGIKRREISKLLGYSIEYKHLIDIENKTFEQLTEKQKKIYDDFINLVNKS